jgi:hypothetical protein
MREELERLNREKISISAWEALPSHDLWQSQPIVHSEWNPGIVGLVAGKLVWNWSIVTHKVGEHYVGVAPRAVFTLWSMNRWAIFIKRGGHRPFLSSLYRPIHTGIQSYANHDQPHPQLAISCAAWSHPTNFKWVKLASWRRKPRIRAVQSPRHHRQDKPALTCENGAEIKGLGLTLGTAEI